MTLLGGNRGGQGVDPVRRDAAAEDNPPKHQGHDAMFS